MPPPTTTTKSQNTVYKGKVKPGVTQNKPVLEAERARRLFSSLCSQIDGGHFVNAIRTCDKILGILPDDSDALSTKLFLLLQTDQYEAALVVINRNKDKSKLAFERAYALYRSRDDDEAQRVIQSLEQNADDWGLAHLKAQLFYRNGLYSEAYNLYNQLLDSIGPDTEEHSDILTNLQATQKHLDFINNGYLRAIDSLPVSISNAIENALPPTLAPPITNIPSSSAQQLSKTSLEKPKRVRKSRIPPGVVPGVTPPPDPERWLKKSERSILNQGRRRRGGGGGATQGSANAEAPASGSASTGKGGKGKRKK